jgi:hypothetical protein
MRSFNRGYAALFAEKLCFSGRGQNIFRGYAAAAPGGGTASRKKEAATGEASLPANRRAGPKKKLPGKTFQAAISKSIQAQTRCRNTSRIRAGADADAVG